MSTESQMYSRLPLNVEGDFYTIGCQDKHGGWYGECLECALPEYEAPDLLAPMDDDHYDTYFIKQPENEKEIEQAISACKVCCVNALRYSGKDKNIIERLGEEYCDYKIDELGNVVLNNQKKVEEIKAPKKSWWKIW